MGGEVRNRFPFLFVLAGDPFNSGADLAQFVFDAFIAAIDVIDAVDPRCIVGYQSC